MDKLVSVIIPCYNLAHFLDETIKSVLSQTYPNLEIVVINDGSSDNTVEVVKPYCDSKIKCITQTQQGVSVARNCGIRESKGAYLIFLDADDRLLPKALESSIKCLEANPQKDFVVNQCRWISEKGSPILTPPQIYLEEEYYFWLLCGVNLANTTGAVTYRRKVFDSEIRFDPQFSAVEDCDFYLYLTRQFSGIYQKEVAVEYRKRLASLSTNNLKLLKDTLEVFNKHLKSTNLIEKYKKAIKVGKINIYIKYGTQLVFETQERLKKYKKLLEKYEKQKSFISTHLSSSQNFIRSLEREISKEKRWFFNAQIMNEEALEKGFLALFNLEKEELKLIKLVFSLYQKDFLKDLNYLAQVYESFLRQLSKSPKEEEFVKQSQLLINIILITSRIKSLE